MSLALAVKRVYRFMDPSPRRWIRKNYLFFFAYAVGLFTGFYAHVNTENIAIYGIITFAVLGALRWWAGPEPEPRSKK